MTERDGIVQSVPRQSWFSSLLLLLIRVYQLMISPLLGPSCRFEPSCSRYAASCVLHFGALRGSWLAVRRLLRCHPFCPGGYDPPPTDMSGSGGLQ